MIKINSKCAFFMIIALVVKLFNSEIKNTIGNKFDDVRNGLPPIDMGFRRNTLTIRMASLKGRLPTIIITHSDARSITERMCI